jgi:hypothetical protein
MPRGHNDSDFTPWVLRDDRPFGAPSLDKFEQQLMGFCVAAQLDQRDETRSWWAERLGLSKSHVSKMTVEPSVAFVEQFDLALAAEAHENERRRLGPKLSDFYADIRPNEHSENSQPVLEWLARRSQLLDRSAVTWTLLESEVALKRCELLGRTGMADRDSLVGAAMDHLLALASGPYGGALIAHQQSAELGLRAPRAFFGALSKHFDTSPVGFRLLRTLDRFVNVWRGLGTDPNSTRQHEVDVGLARLLLRLGRASSGSPYLDPYPGAEWSITLARDCLRTGQESKLARDWLAATYENKTSSDRARLYAAWVSVEHPGDDGSDAVLRSLRSSRSSLLSRWADLFGRHKELAELKPEDRQVQVEEVFDHERLMVHEAIRACVTDEDRWGGVKDALDKLVFAVLVTPDSRTRRALIESVVTANLVTPTVPVLLNLYYQAELVPGIRETVIFFLSRMREPSSEVTDVFLKASAHRDRNVAHTALWGLGDISWPGSELAVDPVVEVLVEAATTDSASEQGARTRIAAAHALAVISSSTGKEMRKALSEVAQAQKADAPGRTVTGLCKWAEQLQAKPVDALVDPTQLGLKGLLQGDVADGDDF